MISFQTLQWVVATSHLLAGVCFVVLTFWGLEKHPLLGLCLGGGVAGGMICLDVMIGENHSAIEMLEWGRVKQLVIIAAVTATVGVAMTALSLRPEWEATEQTNDTTNDRQTRSDD